MHVCSFNNSIEAQDQNLLELLSGTFNTIQQICQQFFSQPLYSIFISQHPPIFLMENFDKVPVKKLFQPQFLCGLQHQSQKNIVVRILFVYV